MITFTKRTLALLVLVFGLTGMSWAQDGPYTVTFQVNTSNIADTLEAGDVVQIRGNFIATGDSAEYGAQNITWDNQSTPVATHQGGDYWTIDVQMKPGDTLTHKFWAGFSLEPEEGIVHNSGWESNGPVGGNYQFVYPSDATGDTTLDMQYYSTGEGRQSPFVEKADSVGVRFRVNVGRRIQTDAFNPDSHEVQARGDEPPLTWDGSTGVVLSEQGQAGDNYFYSGIAYFHKDSVATDNTINYKYFANGWEDAIGNRLIEFGTIADTTLHFSYFNNQKPTQSKIITTNIDFAVNVGILEGLGYFNSNVDTVELRGDINNWSAGEDVMSFSGLTNSWVLNDREVTREVGGQIAYKYFVNWDENPPGITQPQDQGYEEPGVTGGGNRTITIEDKENHATGTQYFNGVPPEALITENNIEGSSSVQVTFSVNMEPATQISDDPFVAGEDSLYILFETPFFALTQDMVAGAAAVDEAAHPDSVERQRMTDGDGDMVYDVTITLKNPTLNHMGFVFGYGQPFSGENMNTNGSGFDAGRRHYQYIQPMFDDDNNVVWPSTFAMPTLDWKAEDLPWEDPPSYSPTPIAGEPGVSPEDYNLSQNYPNPFNPTTNIKFSLPTAGDVNLSVYNVLGQKVTTLLDKRMSAGSHVVGFNASSYASGVYIYRLEAGDVVKQKRMTLIK